ncbi:uncharacterized protein LOC102215352, partial [Pundamilia nyererei]|uniref:Uncharacterized protein LOC102215352 n=1 Tax=Pundamilia nyererei TaxID=303518 RepID=A0A9Y3SBA9_9CICH
MLDGKKQFVQGQRLLDGKQVVFKKRLDHLRDHHEKCSEKYTKYINAQQENSSDSDSNVMTVTGEPPPVLEDPEVPPLERTDSIFLPQDYLDQLSKVSDELETLSSCVEWTEDEFVPPKELMVESSSEGSVDVPAQRPMKRKKRKPHRTLKRAKQTITCSDKDSRSIENEKDTKRAKRTITCSDTDSRSTENEKDTKTEKVLDCPDSEVSDTEGDSSFCSPGGSSTPQEKQNMESDGCSFESGTTNSNEKEHTVEPEKCPSKTGSLVTPWMMESDNDTPVKGASQKRSWSAVETHAVEKTLKSFIESGKVPGKADCVSCIEASPKELENRTWKA